MTKYVNTPNGGPLNLRQTPSTLSTLLCTIPNGTKLEVEEANTEWYSTTYNSKSGYIMKKYLSDASTSNLDKAALQKIYNSLKETLSMIEEVLK